MTARHWLYFLAFSRVVPLRHYRAMYRTYRAAGDSRLQALAFAIGGWGDHPRMCLPLK